MGPLIDQVSVVNFSKIVEQAVNQDGKVWQVVRALLKLAFLLSQRLLKLMLICRSLLKKTFVRYYTYFKDIDEVIKLNNSVRYGLSSSIFTDNLQNAEKFLSSLGSDCGIANVNIGT